VNSKGEALEHGPWRVVAAPLCKLDENQRLMSAVAERIDGIFDSEPGEVEPDVRDRMRAKRRNRLLGDGCV
jgi:hypothetical protein